MVQTVDLAHGIDQKTCNIRAIVARNGGCAERFGPTNPSRLLEITLFFTWCDPASAPVCHESPISRPGSTPLIVRLKHLALATGAAARIAMPHVSPCAAEPGSPLTA